MRNFATYRVFFASAISVLILLAASCIRNEKVVPEYQDRFESLTNEAIEYYNEQEQLFYAN